MLSTVKVQGEWRLLPILETVLASYIPITQYLNWIPFRNFYTLCKMRLQISFSVGKGVQYFLSLTYHLSYDVLTYHSPLMNTPLLSNFHNSDRKLDIITYWTQIKESHWAIHPRTVNTHHDHLIQGMNPVWPRSARHYSRTQPKTTVERAAI